MHPKLERIQNRTRRHFFKETGAGLGGIALASMLAQDAPAAPASKVVDPLAPKKAHFDGKAKRVIYLHMTGSPPHLDLFDYKPELVKHDGENCPDAYLKGKRFAFTSG